MFFGLNTIILLESWRFGYSSKVGLIIPIFPSIFSIIDLISSAAPLPTIILSFFISKILETNDEFTFRPDGYCSSKTLKLYFSSSTNFFGGK